MKMNMYWDWILIKMICEVVGSWRVQLQSYNLSLNMWIPEVAQLKTGIAIVVKFRFPKSCFICLCDSWPHFDSWRNRCKNLVLFGKNKWDNAKHSLSLTRKILFFCFSFSDISYTFSTLFQPKIVHMDLFKPFHAYYT